MHSSSTFPQLPHSPFFPLLRVVMPSTEQMASLKAYLPSRRPQRMFFPGFSQTKRRFIGLLQNFVFFSQ